MIRPRVPPKVWQTKTGVPIQTYPRNPTPKPIPAGDYRYIQMQRQNPIIGRTQPLPQTIAQFHKKK